MEKLDRSGWAAGRVIGSFGVRIGLRCTLPHHLDRLVESLPPQSRRLSGLEVSHLYSLVGGGEGPRPGMRRYHVLYVGASRLARSLDLEEVLEAFRSDIHLRVAEHARGRVFVHAGVVGWRGSAIVIPGRSFSGKSTLVRALVESGADYYSDDFAVLDSRGSVYPFPKPLSIRDEQGAGSRLVRVEDLGGSAGVVPLPIGRIVLTEYRPGALWRPRRCSPGRSVLEILAHTVPARRKPAAAISAIRCAIAHAPVLKGRRGEANGLAKRLLFETA